MLTTTTSSPLDRLRAALSGGAVPEDLITPLRDLLHDLDFATGAVDRAAEHFPDDPAQQAAYRAETLGMVLDGYTRLLSVAPLAGSGG